MEAFVVITRTDVLAQPLGSLLPGCSVYVSGGDRLVVERGASHAFVVQDQSLRAHYLDEAALPAVVREESNYYLFEFNDRSFVQEILASLRGRLDGWVDDDHGAIVPLR